MDVATRSHGRSRKQLRSVGVNEANRKGNVEMARYWTEDAGPSWVRSEETFDLMLAPYNASLLDALALQPGERVLEVGCGFGSTALAAIATGALVHGVDISPPMIERARARSAEVGAGATFAVADAQEEPLGGPYDAVMSRFGVMFFADPVRAFANVVAAMRPDGRLAFVCWQPLDRNPWMTGPTTVLRGLMDDPPPAAPVVAGPFAFGDTAYVALVLADAGWQSPTFTSIDIEIRMGGNDGVPGAVNQALDSSMARALLARGDADLRERATAVLTDEFSAIAIDGVVRFPAAVWLVTARAPASAR